MENKGTAASSPLGFCEKVFNALHLSPTFRPLRRIAYHPQEPTAAAAAMPAPLPPVPSPVGKAPAPPIKSSGLEHPGRAVGSLHHSKVSVEGAPEVRPSRIEPNRGSFPLKAPSKVEPQVATIPSKNFTYIEPQAPSPAQLPTERSSNTPGKAPVHAPPPAPVLEKVVSSLPIKAAVQTPPPAPVPEKVVSNLPSKAPVHAPPPAPVPEKVVSSLDDVKTSVDNVKPAAAEMGRTRTRRNLNEKADEYISRVRNRMRTRSNAGSSSSKG